MTSHFNRITVPPDCPCDFRYTGVPPSVEPCRACGRNFGSWLSCPKCPSSCQHRLVLTARGLRPATPAEIRRDLRRVATEIIARSFSS